MTLVPIIKPEFDLEEDLRIYGNKVYTYAINGEHGKCFSDVLAYASIQQSFSIENVAMAFTDIVNLRQKKVRDLGEAASIIAEGLGAIDPSDPKGRTPGDMSTKITRLREIVAEYQVHKENAVQTANEDKMTREELMVLQNDVQTALDMENNDLRQVMTSLEGLLRKRDNSFSNASKIIEKNNKSAQGAIRATGA